MCSVRRRSGLRSDAERNRARILEAARGLFASTAGEPAMDEVARRAGVGRATLYRNFADIEVLSEVVFAENIEALEVALRCEVDAVGGFERMMWLTVEQGLACRALMPALASHAGSPRVARLMERVTRPLAVALRSAQRRGELRGDLGAGEVVLLLAMVFASVLTDPDAKDPRPRARRALRLVLEGARAPVVSPRRGAGGAAPRPAGPRRRQASARA